MSSTTQFVVLHPMPGREPSVPEPAPSRSAGLLKRIAGLFTARRRRPQVLYADRLSRHLQRDIGLGP